MLMTCRSYSGQVQSENHFCPLHVDDVSIKEVLIDCHPVKNQFAQANMLACTKTLTHQYFLSGYRRNNIMTEENKASEAPQFHHFLPAIAVLCLIFFGLIFR